MSCWAITGRKFVYTDKPETLESCPELETFYTSINEERVDVSRCPGSGSFVKLFTEPFESGSPESFWKESIDEELSVDIDFFNYSVPVTGLALATFSDQIPASGFVEGTLEGYITGSGYLTGTLCGDMTGYAGIEDTENVSEVCLQREDLFFATGLTYFEWTAFGSGLATGEGFTGIAQGSIEGSSSIEVVDPPESTSTPRGHAFFNEQVTGSPSDIYAFDGVVNDENWVGFSVANQQPVVKAIDGDDLFIFVPHVSRGVRDRTLFKKELGASFVKYNISTQQVEESFSPNITGDLWRADYWRLTIH